MADFIEETSKSTMFKVVINLRSVEVAFPSKHFFEELYNRYIANTWCQKVHLCFNFDILIIYVLNL